MNSARLGGGRFWVTHTTVGGATTTTHPALVDSNGLLVVQTLRGGAGYRVQATGATLRSEAYPSLRWRVRD